MTASRLSTEPAAGTAGLIDGVEAFIGRSRVLAGVERDSESIMMLCEQARAHQSSIESPLRVLLLGGTGVGKSTTLNALAGREIAQASPIRPTTRAVTVYVHEDDTGLDLGPLEEQATFHRHDRSELRNKVIIDAPDFDSSVIENRVILEQLLAVSDLVLCVVTSEKYLSHELFERLRAHREGLSFVFVVNKADLGGAGEVGDDFAKTLAEAGFAEPQVLRISSRIALAARLEGERPEEIDDAGDFPALVNLLEHELDRTRVRRIKTSNQRERMQRLVARVRRAVPEDGAERLVRWRAGLETDVADLVRDLSRHAVSAIDGDPRFRLGLAFLHAQSFRSLFGAFMAVVYGGKAILRPGYPRIGGDAVDSLSRAVVERLEDLDPAELDRRLRDVVRRFVAAAGREGFAREPIERRLLAELDANGERPEGGDALRGAGARLVESVHRTAARRARAVCEEAAFGRAMRWWNLLLNAPAWGIVLLTLALPLLRLAGHDLLGAASASDGLYALLAYLLVGWVVAERAVRRRAAQALGDLEKEVAASLGEALDGAVVEPARRTVAQVAAVFEEADALAERIGSPPRPSAAPGEGGLARAPSGRLGALVTGAVASG